MGKEHQLHKMKERVLEMDGGDDCTKKHEWTWCHWTVHLNMLRWLILCYEHFTTINKTKSNSLFPHLVLAICAQPPSLKVSGWEGHSTAVPGAHQFLTFMWGERRCPRSWAITPCMESFPRSSFYSRNAWLTSLPCGNQKRNVSLPWRGMGNKTCRFPE